jgi:hypothetical protein
MRIQRLSGHRLKIAIVRALRPSAHSARTRIQLPYLSLVVMIADHSLIFFVKSQITRPPDMANLESQPPYIAVTL